VDTVVAYFSRVLKVTDDEVCPDIINKLSDQKVLLLLSLLLFQWNDINNKCAMSVFVWWLWLFQLRKMWSFIQQHANMQVIQ